MLLYCAPILKLPDNILSIRYSIDEDYSTCNFAQSPHTPTGHLHHHTHIPYAPFHLIQVTATLLAYLSSTSVPASPPHSSLLLGQSGHVALEESGEAVSICIPPPWPIFHCELEWLLARLHLERRLLLVRRGGCNMRSRD